MIRPTKEGLGEIRTRLKSALYEKIEKGQEGPLSPLQGIHYGDTYQVGNLKFPCLLVIPQPHTPTQSTMGTRLHGFSYTLAVMVRNTKSPGAGVEEAETLVSHLYDLMMEDRSLSSNVSDITVTSIEPAYDLGGNKSLFGAAINITLNVSRYE